MSKYEPLWHWIRASGTDRLSLTFEEIAGIAGVPLDHSFLTYKKELLHYGYEVIHISMKAQTVTFRKLA